MINNFITTTTLLSSIFDRVNIIELKLMCSQIIFMKFVLSNT